MYDPTAARGALLSHAPCVVTTNAVMAQPAVWVNVFVFKHARFLEKALGSIEMHVLDQDFEINIHDDASTDASHAICEQSQQSSQHKVTVLRQTLNKVSRKVSFWPKVIAQYHGDLITFGDGDDFWTSPIKLQTQCVATQSLPAADLFFHRVIKVDHATVVPTGALDDYVDGLRIFAAGTVVEGDGGFMPTVSLMLRKSVLLDMAAWFFRSPPVGYYFIQVQGSLRGGALYLPMRAAAYRGRRPAGLNSAHEHRSDARDHLRTTLHRLAGGHGGDLTGRPAAPA